MVRLGDGVGYSDCNGQAATLSRHRAGSLVPCDSPCAALDVAPPDEPPERTSRDHRCQIGQGVFTGGGVWLGEAAAWGDPLVDPAPEDGPPSPSVPLPRTQVPSPRPLSRATRTGLSSTMG